jgi:hypothetical protein
MQMVNLRSESGLACRESGLALRWQIKVFAKSLEIFSMMGFLGSEERSTIDDRASLKRWLYRLPADRRKHVAIVIAARAALRALPLIALDTRQLAPSLRLPVFWSCALTWGAAKYPLCRDNLPSNAAFYAAHTARLTASRSTVAHAAARATAAHAAAAFAAKTVIGDDAHFDPNTAANAAFFAATYSADAWDRTSADAAALDSGCSPSDLASEPLWPAGAPDWVQEHWMHLNQLLVADHGKPWIDWYQRRLSGNELSEEIELLFATLPVDPSRKAPADQNELLAQEIARLMLFEKQATKTWDALDGFAIDHRIDAKILPSAAQQQPSVSIPKPAAIEPIVVDIGLTKAKLFDFFLSYSNKNDAFARFVDDVLCKAGYRVFAQWRDMPVGSNFVHEMNKGLARSERLVALLSPDYVASEHAMSELASAYNDDADGSKRKIVPFIIAPVDPPPLFQQIVWRQIFSLSRDDAVRAILTAVGFEGVVTPDKAWPGAQTLDAMTRESSEWYHVAPDAQGVIRRKHAARAEGLREKEGYDAAELYAQMRREIEKIREHVCDSQGGGNFSFSPRLQKRLRRLAVETPENIEECSPLALDEALKDVLRVLELDRKEDCLPPHDEIGPFSVDLNDHYQLLSELFPSLRQYRKQSARRRYKRPPPEVLAAFSVIPNAAKETEIIDKDLASDLAATGEAIEIASDATLGAQDDARDAEADAHLRAATQVTPLWNWLSNPREKFARLGLVVKDLPEVIEKYDKAYERLAKAKPYVQWLLSWWF